MSRKKSLSKGLFGMAPAIVDAALAELSPEQRDSINANQAQRIMEAGIACAGTIGRILEGEDNPPGRAAPDYSAGHAHE